jgi:hypothetical protein
MPRSQSVVPDVRIVHVMPSGDVMIVPFIPTAVNWVPDQTTLKSQTPVPDVRVVHVMPSGDVTIVP